MEIKKKNITVNKPAFLVGVSVLVIFIIAGILFQKQVGEFLTNALYSMASNWGWYFNLLSVISLLLVIVVILMRHGDTVIGGPDAKPEFKTFNWISMAICGGIGTGLLFWAMGEPIFHFSQPPVAAGVEPLSREAAIFAVSQAMWDWSFIQYAMYTLCAIGFALLVFNKKKNLSFGSIVESVFGRKIKWLETLIHGFVIFCLAGAVANSMGVGLLQIGAGLQSVFGMTPGPAIWLVIAAIIASISIISSIAGLSDGLQKISDFTIKIFFALLIYVFIFGDTNFITKIGIESVGNIIDNWGQKTTIMNTMAPGDTWYADWIIQYWASFVVYAPVIGMFLSRLAKGRTIKQFVVVNLAVPSLFCWLWIAIFGGQTISLQYSGTADVVGAVAELGMEATIFQILASMPFGKILIVAFLVSIFGSFITMADPMFAVLGTVATNGLTVNDEAPKHLKILFGILVSTVSFLLVASGGINSVKGLFTLVGFPMSFVMILCWIASFKVLKENQAIHELHVAAAAVTIDIEE